MVVVVILCSLASSYKVCLEKLYLVVTEALWVTVAQQTECQCLALCSLAAVYEHTYKFSYALCRCQEDSVSATGWVARCG